MTQPLPILVVEDHSINREVAVLQLKALGFECQTANNGVEAVEAVANQQFSLILMDVMMPHMDGWEAATRIRQIESASGRRTPIVAVSAWSAADSKEKCMAVGMDDYLDKPYNREALEKVVRRWTAQSLTTET
jgi:CheY-like chemotaxis protein